jgi:hypothetical protein
MVIAAGCADTVSPTHDARRVIDAGKATDDRKVVEGGKKSLFDKNLYFETQGDKRRVIISAAVAQREGFSEFFLCRANTKEYESILVADVDPQKVHEALLATGAKTGSPVQFEPKFRPPEGTVIKVTLQWESNGRRLTAPAQSWLRDKKTQQEMACDWVFAGSMLVDNPLDLKRPKTYLANVEGIILTLGNLESAVLDVSIRSAKQRANQEFEPFTEHIPPQGTKVSVILEPVK